MGNVKTNMESYTLTQPGYEVQDILDNAVLSEQFNVHVNDVTRHLNDIDEAVSQEVSDRSAAITAAVEEEKDQRIKADNDHAKVRAGSKTTGHVLVSTADLCDSKTLYDSHVVPSSNAVSAAVVSLNKQISDVSDTAKELDTKISGVFDTAEKLDERIGKEEDERKKVIADTNDAIDSLSANLSILDTETGKKLPYIKETGNADFDTLTETGVYHIFYGDGDNHPQKGTGGTLFVDNQMGVISQLYMHDTEFDWYKRTRRNNVWDDWVKLDVTGETAKKHAKVMADCFNEGHVRIVNSMPPSKDAPDEFYTIYDMANFVTVRQKIEAEAEARAAADAEYERKIEGIEGKIDTLIFGNSPKADIRIILPGEIPEPYIDENDSHDTTKACIRLPSVSVTINGENADITVNTDDTYDFYGNKSLVFPTGDDIYIIGCFNIHKLTFNFKVRKNVSAIYDEGYIEFPLYKYDAFDFGFTVDENGNDVYNITHYSGEYLSEASLTEGSGYIFEFHMEETNSLSSMLKTSSKRSIVDAVNEVNSKITDLIGTIDTGIELNDITV